MSMKGKCSSETRVNEGIVSFFSNNFALNENIEKDIPDNQNIMFSI